MARQERTARAVKRAAAQATAIVAAETAKVQRFRCRRCGGVGPQGAVAHEPTCERAQKPAKATTPRPAPAPSQTPASGGTVDLRAECHRLRGTGMAWWLIAKTLGLPGAGDSAATGKAGAHAARRLYASDGTAVPRVQKRKNSRVVPEGPGQVGTKTERKIRLTQGYGAFNDSHSDEDIILAVSGRTIEWAIDIRALCDGRGEPEWLNQEATVTPELDYCIIDEKLSKDGSRVLRFREWLGNDKGEPIYGPTRSVRVNAIHTVR